MVIRPYGYALWERIQRALDDMLKRTGHENMYFPLLIPESYLLRSRARQGLRPRGGLGDPGRAEGARGAAGDPADLGDDHLLDVRDWIHSYRDLPVLINQWANVMRWEKRTGSS